MFPQTIMNWRPSGSYSPAYLQWKKTHTYEKCMESVSTLGTKIFRSAKFGLTTYVQKLLAVEKAGTYLSTWYFSKRHFISMDILAHIPFGPTEILAHEYFVSVNILVWGLLTPGLFGTRSFRHRCQNICVKASILLLFNVPKLTCVKTFMYQNIPVLKCPNAVMSPC